MYIIFIPDGKTDIIEPLELEIKKKQNVDPVSTCRFFPIPVIETLPEYSELRAFHKWKNTLLGLRGDLSTNAIVNGLERHGYRFEIGSLELRSDQESETTNAFKVYLRRSSMLYMANIYGEPQVQLLCANMIQELERKKVTVLWELYV